MVLLASDGRTPGQRLADYANRLTVLAAELDATHEPLNLSVSDITAESAVLHWTPIAGTTSYVVGRDGRDKRNNPPTAFFDPPRNDRRQYVWLNPATTYTVFVLALPSGVGQSIQFTTGG